MAVLFRNISRPWLGHLRPWLHGRPVCCVIYRVRRDRRPVSLSEIALLGWPAEAVAVAGAEAGVGAGPSTPWPSLVNPEHTTHHGIAS